MIYQFWQSEEGKSNFVGWHTFPVKYRTCCLNRGRHIPCMGKYVDWNSELIWKMRAESDFQWDGFEDELRAMIRELCASIRYRFGASKFHFGAKRTWPESDEDYLCSSWISPQNDSKPWASTAGSQFPIRKLAKRCNIRDPVCHYSELWCVILLTNK